MRTVTRPGSFETGILAYHNKLAKRLVQTLEYGSKFSQARAKSNLKQIGLSLKQSQVKLQSSYGQDAQLAAELSRSQTILQQADQGLKQAREKEQKQRLGELSNEGRISNLVLDQRNAYAHNQVLQTDDNWDISAPVQAPAKQDVEKKPVFNEAWLGANRLFDQGAGKGAGKDRVQQGLRQRENRPPSRSSINIMLDTPQAEVACKTIVSGTGPAAAKALLPQPAPGAIDKVQQQQQELLARYEKKLKKREKQERGAQGVPGIRLAGEELQTQTPGRPGEPEEKLEESRDESLGLAVAGQGLTSLDVELPRFDASRWQRYRFTTPRGDIRIRGRALSHATLENCRRLGIVALAVVLAIAAGALLHARPLSQTAAKRLSILLMTLGSVGLLCGIFPGIGLLTLVGGVAWRMARSSRAQRSTVDGELGVAGVDSE